MRTAKYTGDERRYIHRHHVNCVMAFHSGRRLLGFLKAPLSKPCQVSDINWTGMRFYARSKLRVGQDARRALRVPGRFFVRDGGTAAFRAGDVARMVEEPSVVADGREVRACGRAGARRAPEDDRPRGGARQARPRRPGLRVLAKPSYAARRGKPRASDNLVGRVPLAACPPVQLQVIYAALADEPPVAHAGRTANRAWNYRTPSGKPAVAPDARGN